MSYTNWRHDPGISSSRIYKKRFAFWKVKCSGGDLAFFKFYYEVYDVWTSDGLPHFSTDYGHPEFIENITKEEYVVRKLSESL